MKNHWLKLHEDRKRRFWTVSFSKYGIYTLKPRRADVLDHANSLAATSGGVEINFKDGMINLNDVEFLDFLKDCKNSMNNWIACFRLYANLLSELEYYEIGDMNYGGLTSGVKPNDLKIHINYNTLKHYFCT